MSRGHGRNQRRAVALLSADERARSEGLPPAVLRRALGLDRSNGRRLVLSLIERGDAEWVTDPEKGERRIKPSFWTCVAAQLKREPLDDEPDPLEEALEHRRAVEEALHDIRAAEEEKRRARRETEALWEEPGRSFERRRSPGPNQLRVIASLVRYAPDPQMGLPGGAVRRIVSEAGEKANALRAVRTLLRRGTLQRSKDGERLRLTEWRLPWRWGHAPHVVDPPLDDAKAEAVLEAFGEPAGCQVAHQPHGKRKYFPRGRK